MSHNRSAAVVALSLSLCAVVFGQDEAHARRAIREATLTEGPPKLVPSDATVGQHLQIATGVRLIGLSPDHALRVTVTSSDPQKLAFAATPDGPNQTSLELNVAAGFRHTPEFYMRALAAAGTVTYTAEAPGYPAATATVTLAQSAILIGGPAKLGATRFRTTTGMPLQIAVYSALLDGDKNVVELQPVGRSPLKVNITTSNPEIGKVENTVIIAPGASTATLQFKPVAPGTTTLSVDVPPGFTAPARFATIAAIVVAPSIGISDQVAIGYNLELNGTLTLGQPAPAEGVNVTLTTNDPSKLLLSMNATDPGSKSITVKVPADKILGTFYLQALGDSGDVTYTASAPGYVSRTATVALRPSGIALAPPGGLDGPRGFLSSLSSARPEEMSIWLAQLDPVYHSSTDQTTQPLRGGLTLTVHITDSNPEVGKTTPTVVFKGGQESAGVKFKALSEGSEVISVVTPEGYTLSKNHSSLKVVVTK